MRVSGDVQQMLSGHFIETYPLPLVCNQIVSEFVSINSFLSVSFFLVQALKQTFRPRMKDPEDWGSSWDRPRHACASSLVVGRLSHVLLPTARLFGGILSSPKEQLPDIWAVEAIRSTHESHVPAIDFTFTPLAASCHPEWLCSDHIS